MKSLKSKLLLIAMIAAVTIILSVSVNAAIKVTDGVVTGLTPSITYEYTQVTILNCENPTYSQSVSGVSRINNLTPGLWFIKNTSTNKVTPVFIEGDPADSNDIGEVYYNESCKKDVLRTKASTEWIEGVWTNSSSVNHSTFATYYLSSHSHISGSIASGLLDGSVTQRKARSLMQEIVYKYAYTPVEIIPVENLVTLGFNTGVRQTAFKINYAIDAEDPNLKTIYKLHTIDENGEHKIHQTVAYTTFTTSNNQSLYVPAEFPDATGWVVGLEIYPFGSIPLNGLEMSAGKNYNNAYTNTCFFIEYLPSLYTTRNETKDVQLPFQYNGANKAYVNGYADGRFLPDADITKAEAATILVNLVLTQTSIPVGTTTRFSDLTPNDWYYDAVNYLEHKNVFDYVKGNRLHADSPVSRGEFAEILYCFASIEAANAKKFSDVAEDHPYAEAIVSLASNGILNGYADGTFRPDDTITRAEVVTVINRTLNLVVNENTVTPTNIENRFSDIDGHWAELQILMASNNNVKSVHHLNASTEGITQTDKTIEFETKQLKVVIDRNSGKVNSLINKYNNENVLASSTSPWFTYVITNSGFTFVPKSLELVDNRLRVEYVNGTVAYFIFEIKDNFFTIEMDSNLPINVSKIYFGNMHVNTEFSNEPDSYRISAVTMNINTNMTNRPGGVAKRAVGYAMRKFGTMGAKLGITFSLFEDEVTGAHRAYLKEIVDHIDETVGVKSTHGGAYTYDNKDVFGDYVIQSSGLTPSTAVETAQALVKYSIDQLDFHQSASAFIQGSFDFPCARETGETFTTAAQFKERIGNIITSAGVQLGLHTYSSLISSSATNILSDPKWQRQIMHHESENLTLEADVSATDTVFLTVEDPSGIELVGEKAGGGYSSLPWSGPNTGYFLIDEEIVLVTLSDETGLTKVERAKCGTTATAHKAGATIIHYLGHYGMFQPIPGSDLFYHIADNTAKAYNEGGFEMIYLDGFESFARNAFLSSDEYWYYYASFMHRVVSQCVVDPIIEGSAFDVSFWNSRARGGAVDHATRETKQYNLNHVKSNVGFQKSYLTATLGWFHYSPDMSAAQKNTFSRTMFRDDLDYMGSLGVAFDMSTVANSFTLSNYNTYKTLSNNTLYYSIYSKLRKGGYFSKAVKETLKEGLLNGKEYKLEKQSDGSWAFREVMYLKHKVYDLTDTTFAAGKGSNPYSAQTPYVRIEQRFSTLSKNKTAVYAFDETVEVSTHNAKTYVFDTLNLSEKKAFKIKVYGNGSTTDGILLTFGSESESETGRLDFFLPTSHTGWREFILIDMDNADYAGYEFAGDYLTSCHYGTFRNSVDYKTLNKITVNLCGSCTGVKIDDINAYTLTNSPAVNPSVTIGDKTITFSATVRSGEYIEYFPELNKAYHHSYNYSATSPTNNGNTAKVTEISFTGSLTVPSGDFTYTYNATPKTGIDASLGMVGGPLRAKVVIGLKSDDIIANEDTWEAPEVVIDESLEYITLT